MSKFVKVVHAGTLEWHRKFTSRPYVNVLCLTDYFKGNDWHETLKGLQIKGFMVDEDVDVPVGKISYLLNSYFLTQKSKEDNIVVLSPWHTGLIITYLFDQLDRNRPTARELHDRIFNFFKEWGVSEEFLMQIEKITR